MRELLAGLVPGLPAPPATRSSPAPTGSRSTRSRPSGCCSPRAASCSRTGSTARPTTSPDLAVPETLTALISARLDELDAGRSVARRRRGGPRPELHAGGRRGGRRRRAPASLEPRLRALVRRELLVQRGRPALARARPVRVRPGAHPRGRLQHAGASATGRSATWPRRASSRRSRPTSWPARWPATTWRPSGYAAEGRRGGRARGAGAGRAARRGRAGSRTRRPHQQAIAFLEHALAVSPDAADRADLHERARASAHAGPVAEVAERHALGAVEARRELGDRHGDRPRDGGVRRRGVVLRDGRERCSRSSSPPGRSSRTWRSREAGVALMLEMSTGYNFLPESATALVWLERLLPIAERLDLLEPIAAGLARLAGTLWRIDRQQESPDPAPWRPPAGGRERPRRRPSEHPDVAVVPRAVRRPAGRAGPGPRRARDRQPDRVDELRIHDGRQRVSCALRAGSGTGPPRCSRTGWRTRSPGLLPRAVRRPRGAQRAPRRGPGGGPRGGRAAGPASWATPSTPSYVFWARPGRRSAAGVSTRRSARRRARRTRPATSSDHPADRGPSRAVGRGPGGSRARS